MDRRMSNNFRKNELQDVLYRIFHCADGCYWGGDGEVVRRIIMSEFDPQQYAGSSTVTEARAAKDITSYTEALYQIYSLAQHARWDDKAVVIRNMIKEVVNFEN
jgi:hypothetical protein